LVNAALIGPKGAATLQDQCDPLERRTLGRDMGLAQQRLTARHDAPPVFTARIADRLAVGMRVTLGLGQAFAVLRNVAWAKRSCRAFGSGGIPTSISRCTTKAAGTSRGLGAPDGLQQVRI
jgi:hypothetical protein